MKKYYRDDDEEDKRADAAPEVTAPPDLEAAAKIPATLEPMPAAAPSLASMTDEELAVELAKRKARRFDERIAALEAEIASLKAERDMLVGDPVLALEPTPVLTAPAPKMTDVNPITGKVRPPAQAKGGKPPKAHTVHPSQCSCGGEGCYLCMRPA